MRPKAKRKKRIVDPEFVFGLAMEFRIANRMLFSHKNRNRALTAFLLNELFTYELMLKCMCLLESKAIPDGHDLSAIFFKLSSGLQKKIIGRYDHLCANDVSSQIALLTAEDPQKLTFEKRIKSLSSAWIRCRYFFQQDEFNIDLSTAMGDAMVLSILELRPDWEKFAPPKI